MGNLSIGFYAPMKSPFHSVASGDRQVARNFMKAFEVAGYDCVLLSELRVHLGDEGDSRLGELQELADLEFDKLCRLWESDISLLPDILFCYHVYYKSPDLLLSRLADYFGLPYVIAEASYASKRSEGLYACGHELSVRCIESADLLLQLNRGDGVGLVDLLGGDEKIVDMCIFGDFSDWEGRQVRDILPIGWGRDCIFVVHAMMRSGDKFRSFEVLAESFRVLFGVGGWRLVIIGGGECEVMVRDLFRDYGDRVLFTGLLGRDEIFDWLGCCDIYVWPCIGEAYGMGLLEALWFGLPMVVGDRLGVRGIVDDCGGILCLEGDIGEFGAGVRRFYDDYWGCCDLIRDFRDYNLGKRGLHGMGGAVGVLEREFIKLKNKKKSRPQDKGVSPRFA